MQNFINQINNAIHLFQHNLHFILLLLIVLVGIHILNVISGERLTVLGGIYPRRLSYLPGILFHPFLHGNFNHLFFNAIPLFLLASFVLFSGYTVFICVSFVIIILSGFAIWLFARPGIHIGASGLIMGYWSYLLMHAYQQGTVLTIGPAIVCIYYFGGFLFQLFPTAVKTSWEAHLFGFLSGIAANYTCPNLFCGYLQGFCSMVESSIR